MSSPVANTADRNFSTSIGYSFFAHFFIFVLAIFSHFFFRPEAVFMPSSMQVDLVGLPDKYLQTSVKDVKPVPDAAVREQEPAPVPVADPAPAPVAAQPLPSDEVAISLEKAAQKKIPAESQKAKKALQKLKLQAAFEKLQQSENIAKNQKSAQKPAGRMIIRGQEISKGSDLRGIARLDHANFVSKIETHVKSKWFRPEWMRQQNFHSEVQVYIDPGGKIIRYEMTKSSGDKAFDKLAIDTVEMASPVPEPPSYLAELLRTEGITLIFGEKT